MEIRLAERADLEQIQAISHDFETEKVWQMDASSEMGKSGASFRISRLPRPMKVKFPRDPQKLSEKWKGIAASFVAEEQEQVIGYLAIRDAFQGKESWILDGAVNPIHRRKGIATALLLYAQRWAIQNKKGQLVLALQSKNYPAIQLVQKMGFEYSGYKDHFFGNQDIAIFFSKELD